MERIESLAFAYNFLSSVSVPDSVVYIDVFGPFMFNQITDYYLGSNIKSVHFGQFMYQSLKYTYVDLFSDGVSEQDFYSSAFY